MAMPEDFSVKFNKKPSPIKPEVVQLLKNYEFPGNVRELKNMTERAIILSKGNPIGVGDFPIRAKTKSVTAGNYFSLNLEENEAELIRLALHNNNNNQIAAARMLGIQRMALARKMQKHNITLSPKDERK